MKQYLKEELEYVNENKDILAYVLVLSLAAGIIGYGIGHDQQSQKVPDTTTVSEASYRALNQSMQEYREAGLEEAQPHIRSGMSYLSILHEKGEDKWGEYWFTLGIHCIEKPSEDQCISSVNATMKALKPQTNFTAH